MGDYGNCTGILVAILRDGSDHDAGRMDLRQADAPGSQSGNHEVRAELSLQNALRWDITGQSRAGMGEAEI